MTPLGTNITHFRADYASVRGEPFRNFYCPILHVDENVPLSAGHIIPRSLGGTTKVLQRRDVDNWFGSFFEAEAKDAISYGLGEDDLLRKFLSGDSKDAKDLKRFKKLMKLHPDADRINVLPRNVDGKTQIFAKPGDLGGAEGKLKVQFGIELDPRSSILTTALRTCHLSWFHRCGYRYVFSKEGWSLAWILRTIYEEFLEPRQGVSRTESGSLMSDRVKQEVNEFCFSFANLIRPLPRELVDTWHDELQRGTLDSGWFIALRDGNDLYGNISILKLGSRHLAVLTPILTDLRGRALLDLAVNFKLDYSLAQHTPGEGTIKIGSNKGHPPLIWPSVKEETESLPAISIRKAVKMVIDSGRW